MTLLSRHRTSHSKQSTILALGTLALLLIIGTVAVGWKVHRRQQERVAVDELTKGGASITYRSLCPAWLKNLVGERISNAVFPRRAKVHILHTAHGTRGEDYFTEEILRFLAQIQGLETLVLHTTAVTDSGLKFVGELHQLESLTLVDTRTVGSGYTHLAQLQSLTRLDLDFVPIDDEGLRALGSIPNLTKLTIRFSGLRNRDLVHIQTCEDLKWLDLSHNPELSDQGIEPLTKLKNLRGLDLTGTRVSDRGIKQLEALPKLTELRLAETQVSESGIQSLQNSRPELKVLTKDPGRPLLEQLW